MACSRVVRRRPAVDTEGIPAADARLRNERVPAVVEAAGGQAAPEEADAVRGAVDVDVQIELLCGYAGRRLGEDLEVVSEAAEVRDQPVDLGRLKLELGGVRRRDRAE